MQGLSRSVQLSGYLGKFAAPRKGGMAPKDTAGVPARSQGHIPQGRNTPMAPSKDRHVNNVAVWQSIVFSRKL